MKALGIMPHLPDSSTDWESGFDSLLSQASANITKIITDISNVPTLLSSSFAAVVSDVKDEFAEHIVDPIVEAFDEYIVSPVTAVISTFINNLITEFRGLL